MKHPTRIYLTKKEFEPILKETRDHRNLAIKQSLPVQAFHQQRRRQDEVAALLARQAYLFNQQDVRCQVSYQVDEALREILTLPNFDLLSGSDNEEDKGFYSPPSAAKKAKQKKRRKIAKASRKRNRQKRK